MTRDDDRRASAPAPETLDYRSGADDRPQQVSPFVNGMLTGASLVFCLGFALVVGSFGNTHSAGLRFFVLAVFSLLCFAVTRVSSGRPYLAGFLVGIAVMALIEGYCFL